MSQEETRIAVLETRTGQQDKDILNMKSDLSSKIDKGFNDMKERFDNFIISNNGKWKMYDNRVTELERKMDKRIEKSDERYNNIEDKVDKMSKIQKFFDAFDSFSNKFTIAVLGSIFLIACSIYEKLK